MAKEHVSSRQTMLVLRSQAGDRDAVDRLLQLHQDALLGYLSKMLGNRADAEDAMQATMIQAVRKIRWLRDPLLFRSWMYRIASRKAFEILRQRKRSKEISNVDYIDVAVGDVPQSLPQMDWVSLIPAWLQRLTPSGREVLILHYLQGFTTEQVAEILGIPLGTAKSRISYSLACIRKQLPQHDGDA